MTEQAGGGDFSEKIKQEREMIWRQYELHADMYKHYLDLLVKFNAAYYGITGAIISFYYLNRDNFPELRYSLLFSVVGSVFFGLLTVGGAVSVWPAKAEVLRLSRRLRLAYEKPRRAERRCGKVRRCRGERRRRRVKGFPAPLIKFQIFVLLLCAALFFTVAGGLLYLFCTAATAAAAKQG